ncbi:MAG: transglycosylase domain-containing protein [Leptospiraceae bacterium]|nr:transglycosylase domain-containing protein [Leptospiraceae bacterium]
MDNSKKFFIITFLIISLFGGGFFGYILSEVDKGEELARLSTYQPTTPTRLYDINGIPFAELFRHKQELLKYQDIPPHVINAFLSVEDNNFFNHFGIDFVAIARAALVNLIHLKIKQGGSTLTQQLSKAILQNSKRNFTRKFIEALLTLQIEEEYTKEEILEIYFNLIYLGHGSTGLSSAASVYFQKDVRDLDLAEGALLARLPKAPVKYSPFKNPEISKNAHLEVLKQMSANGYLPKQSVQKIHSEFWARYWPIVITQSPSSSTWGNRMDRAPYFTEYVRQQLEKELGEESLYTAGLKIYTTLDIRKQEIADKELHAALVKQDKIAYGANKSYVGGVDRELVDIYRSMGRIFPIADLDITRLDERANFRSQFEKELFDAGEILSILTPTENESAAMMEFRRQSAVFSENLHVEGAVITIEPSTGYIQVMVGGSKFTPKNQFNRAMQARRQTGSAFKPFVYGAAINERAVASGTGIMDAPLMTLTDDGQGWAPEDIEGGFKGMIPLSRALALSINIVSVQVYFRVGPDAIIDFVSKLTKINKNRLPAGPALSLGVPELTPYEMALGYAIIANKGRDVIPFSVRYVIDQSGNTVINKEIEVQRKLALETKDGSIQVIPEATAYILRRMLTEVAVAGTASSSLRDKEMGNYHGVAAGKTGSTSSYTNAWFCGFDPKYTTVFWMGFDKSTISLGRSQTASGTVVAPWGRIYRGFYDGKNYPKFGDEYGNDPAPPDVVNGATCAINGLTPRPGVCPLISSLSLKPIMIAGQYKGVPANRMCDGERDHMKSLDFREFLQQEYKISDDEIGKGRTDKYKVNTE